MKKRTKQALYRAFVIFLFSSIFIWLLELFVGNPLLFAPFASSMFVIFMHPYSKIGSMKNVVFGHGLSGIVGFSLTFILPQESFISGGIAIALAAFLMVIFKVEHASAAATSLSFFFSLGGGTGRLLNFGFVLVMIIFLGLVKTIWRSLEHIGEEVVDEIEHLAHHH